MGGTEGKTQSETLTGLDELDCTIEDLRSTVADVIVRCEPISRTPEPTAGKMQEDTVKEPANSWYVNRIKAAKLSIGSEIQKLQYLLKRLEV